MDRLSEPVHHNNMYFNVMYLVIFGLQLLAGKVVICLQVNKVRFRFFTSFFSHFLRIP